jgi:hypothetical protein
MNESLDPLESELLALRPIAHSPELRARIGTELGKPEPQLAHDSIRGWKSVRRFQLYAMAACVAAFCLVLGVWRGSRSGRDQRTPDPQPSPLVVRSKGSPSSNNVNQSTAWTHEHRDSDLHTRASFAWPLDEKSPLKGYTSIPADLLE